MLQHRNRFLGPAVPEESSAERVQGIDVFRLEGQGSAVGIHTFSGIVRLRRSAPGFHGTIEDGVLQCLGNGWIAIPSFLRLLEVFGRAGKVLLAHFYVTESGLRLPMCGLLCRGGAEMLVCRSHVPGVQGFVASAEFRC